MGAIGLIFSGLVRLDSIEVTRLDELSESSRSLENTVLLESLDELLEPCSGRLGALEREARFLVGLVFLTASVTRSGGLSGRSVGPRDTDFAGEGALSGCGGGGGI